MQPTDLDPCTAPDCLVVRRRSPVPAILIPFLLCLVAFSHVASIAGANPDPLGPPSGPSIPGVAAGIGTRFETGDSEVMNVTLESSDSVSVHLQTIPGNVALTIYQHAAVPSVRLTLSRLAPSRTYYVTVDDFRNPLAMVSSADSVLTWDQDVTTLHTIFISETTHTITLNDTGFSSPVGTWDPVSRIATLGQNVTETLQITSSLITLDGGGFTLSAQQGIVVQGTSIQNVTIKNMTISSQQSIYGIACKNLRIEGVTSNTWQYGRGFTTGDDGAVILNCTVIGGEQGITAYSPWHEETAPSIISGCTMLNSMIGVHIQSTRVLHTMINNTFIGNLYHFYANQYNIGFLCINFEGSNLAGPTPGELRPILYFSGQDGLVIDGHDPLNPYYNAAAIYLANCQNTTIKNMALPGFVWLPVLAELY